MPKDKLKLLRDTLTKRLSKFKFHDGTEIEVKWRKPRRDKEDIDNDQNTLGICFFDQKIYVDPRLAVTDPKEFFETTVHELMHQINPRWSEEAVASSSNDLAGFLWKAGFRFKE